MADGQPVLGSLYVYAPNKEHPYSLLLRTLPQRSVIFGSVILFTAGYALREYGALNYLYSPQNLIIFILSQVFIYICPPLLELANYHILGGIFHYVPHLAPLPPGRVLSTFGALMALVELLNALGVALSSNPSSSHSQQETGRYMTIAALVLQLAVIVIFVLLAVIFHHRCANANIHAKAVSTPMATLYMSMLLILIRCIYRLVEHMGNTTVDLDDMEALRSLTPVLRYEWFFYVFESTLMLLNSVLWNIWNPGRYLPRNYNVYLAQDGRTEVERPEKVDTRPLLAKIASTLTFGILFCRKEDYRPVEELGPYSRQQT